MHFLLIPYALLSLLFILQFQARSTASSRGGLVITSIASGAMLFIVMMLRPATGDSWRYYQHFLDLRGLALDEALKNRASDPLFTLLNWAAGQIGSAEWLLFGATLIVFFSVFVLALRRILTPMAAAVLFMCYLMFPFLVSYAASGLRQGLAMVFMLMALVQLFRGKRSAWIWLAMVPYWHSGAWLAVIVIGIHQLMCRVSNSQRARWLAVLGALGTSILLSATGLNEVLLGQLPDMFEVQAGHQVYFTDPAEFGYRAGFRVDFLLFSLAPLATGLLLRRRAPTFDYAASGWWLSVYLSLNIIYHLFAFAPFADRFAGFSWFLMPLVVYLQVQEARSRRLQGLFVTIVVMVNVVVLQMYTGKFIAMPEWL